MIERRALCRQGHAPAPASERRTGWSTGSSPCWWMSTVCRRPDRNCDCFPTTAFNLFSIHDRDHGDGNDLKAHLKDMAQQALGHHCVDRFLMLCYPRVLGYVFNPLTVYYGLDAKGETIVTIYEVSNTFGERHTYALKADAGDDGLIRQDCEKVFHVSPFNRVSGTYAFRTRLPGAMANVGILLNDENGPLIAAHFSGTKRPLCDRMLAGMFPVPTAR